VIIGLLETHGRSDTARLAQDLPRLQKRSIQHHGVELQELDVEAAISRQPELLLMDELAHTNALGV
jgi:two-component system sensor histidine kinase KdpD